MGKHNERYLVRRQPVPEHHGGHPVCALDHRCVRRRRPSRGRDDPGAVIREERGLARHEPDCRDDNREQNQRENDWSSDFVLLGLVVVLIVCHAAKIHHRMQRFPHNCSCTLYCPAFCGENLLE